MHYDQITEIDGIDYGTISGAGALVFIKVGLGGTCTGYEGKYLSMAERLKARYGYGVIVASNPNDGKDHVQADRKSIERYFSDGQAKEKRLLFFGHSNGGIKGLTLTAAGISFEKMLLVNMPLMINLHKTRRYIREAAKTKIIAVYGEHDPSFSYIPFLEGKSENVRVMTFPGADHNFSGFTDAFIALSDMLGDAP